MPIDDITSPDLKNHRRVTLRLDSKILETIQDFAKKSWDSISDVLNQWLEKFIVDNFCNEERKKEIWDIIWDLQIEDLENEVLNYLDKEPSEFASWTEAKIYKMHIPWKQNDFLVAKRKYKWTSTTEFDLHSKAKDIELLFKKDNKDSLVHIPALFHHFNKDWEEYLLMEYIKWKTLYLMIIESILSKETIAYGEKIKDKEVQKEFYSMFYYILKDKKEWELDKSDFDKLSVEDIKS